MKWPWVSRLAFELVKSERDVLRDQVDTLQRAAIALQRKSAGMPELPRTQLPPQREDLPPEVLRILQGYESEAMRNALEDDVRSARRAGTPWSEIVRLLELDHASAWEAP